MKSFHQFFYFGTHKKGKKWKPTRVCWYKEMRHLWKCNQTTPRAMLTTEGRASLTCELPWVQACEEATESCRREGSWVRPSSSLLCSRLCKVYEKKIPFGMISQWFATIQTDKNQVYDHLTFFGKWTNWRRKLGLLMLLCTRGSLTIPPPPPT